MKLRASVNGTELTSAEVSGRGHLGLHLNLDDKSGSGSPDIDVTVGGYDANDPKSTRYLTWARVRLSPGDRIVVDVMGPGEVLEPIEVRTSLNDRTKISTSLEDSEKVLAAAYACNAKLNEVLTDLKVTLPTDVYNSLAYGVGGVITEVFQSIAEPIYRVHPSLVPEELRDMPL